MAGEWIKIRTALLSELEVMHLARVLKVTKHDVVGRLVALWGWASGVTEDGTLPGCTLADIDAVVEKKGFAAALAAIPARPADAEGEHTGWLVVTERGLVLPNFDRHNGASGKTRCQAARRQARQRERVTPASRAGRDGSEAQEGSGVTLASRSRHAPRVTREEKRREEQSAAAGAAASVHAAAAAAGGGGVWSHGFSREDAMRLVTTWNAAVERGGAGAKANSFDVTHVAGVYAAISVADSLTPEQRADPVAWLQGRLEAYLASWAGRTLKTTLGRWLRPKDNGPCLAFQTDESWAKFERADTGGSGGAGGSGAADVDLDALVAEGDRRRGKVAASAGVLGGGA